MTSESGWYALKQELIKYINTELGGESEYESLKVTEVSSVLLRDLTDWEKIVRENGSPIITVQSLKATFSNDQHGSVVWPVGREYFFLIAAVVAGTTTTVEEHASILLERTINALRTKTGYGFVIEHAGQSRGFYLDIRDASAYFWRGMSTNAHAYYGMNVLEVRLFSG